MKSRFVLLGGLLNSATLLIGLLIGFFLGTSYSGRVHAQTTQPVEEITPQITAGSAAFGTLLAGRAAMDNISIQGLDVLKFDQNVLNLMGSKPLIFTRDELQGVVDKSRSEKLLKMKQLEKPKEQK